MKVIAASTLLPLSEPSYGSCLQDAAVAFDEGRIVDVGPREKIVREYAQREEEVVDFSHSVLLPGLVNAHTHLDLLFYGENRETSDFFDWLVGGWNHRKEQTLTDRRHALEEGLTQLKRSGTTCVGDAGHYAGLIPQAMNSGLRMVLFPELLTGGDRSIQETYEDAFSQVEEIHGGSSSRVTPGIAPYAAYTLSRHFLKLLSEQAHTLNIPIQIHVSETFSEMQFFYESTGEIATDLFPKMGWAEQIPPAHRRTPIQYLESIGFLKSAPALVGCNHLAEPDIEIIAKSGAQIIHSPRANTLLKLGHPPLKRLLRHGIPVALGTDGTASKLSLSLWEEMRFILEHYPENDRPEPLDLLRMATLNGAKALGLSKKIGSIEKGKAADFIVIKLSKEVDSSSLPEWLIRNVTPREIQSIWVEGKRLDDA